jgi:hypothetical protein
MYHITAKQSDSAVGVTTGYGLEDRGVGLRVQVGARRFSTSSRPVLGAYLASCRMYTEGGGT